MNKALNWYNNLKEGDKIGNITIKKCFTGHIEVQETLEDYIQVIKTKTNTTSPFSLWEMAEEQLSALEEEYGTNGVIQLFKGTNFYNPYRILRSEEHLLMDENNAPYCINKHCNCNNHFKRFDGNCSMAWSIAGCIINELINLLIIYYIGGWSGIKAYEKESKKYLDPEIFRYIEKTWDKDYIGIEEENLYNSTFHGIFYHEEDLIMITEKEYEQKKPYFVDKWEIMNMLEEKPMATIISKVADNHYILNELYDDSKRIHLICPMSANKEKKEWWKEIRWILNNSFQTKFKKENIVF